MNPSIFGVQICPATLKLLFDENVDQRILPRLRLQIPRVSYVMVQNADLAGARDASPLQTEFASGRRDFGIPRPDLVPADESPRHIPKCREGRGFSPAMENGLSWGASAPEARWLQGLKAQLVGLPAAAGLKPRPSKVPPSDGDFRH
jgi:hypothetical protein